MKKILMTITLALVICAMVGMNLVYGATDKEQLVDMLNEYKNELGDLNKFKEVVDKTYNDLNSATTVDEELKNTLRADINELENVTGMNPLVLRVLKDELNKQVDSLNDSNLQELKDEISVIKEWVDQQVGASSGTDEGNNNEENNTDNNTDNNTNNNTDNSTDNNINNNTDNTNTNTNTNNNTNTNRNTNNNTNSNTNTSKNTNTSAVTKNDTDNEIPYAGTSSKIVLAIAIITVIGIMAKLKTEELRGV